MAKQYSACKIFHFTDKINSLPASVDEIKAPVHVRIKPINACNHDCSYCAYRVPQLQIGRDMNLQDRIPRNKMLEIIDDLEEMGVSATTFTGGGEPLLYPHILETLERLAQTQIKFRVFTNGVRLDGKVAEVIAQHGSWLRVSMDGWDDQSYREYRNISREDYTAITQNMKKFKQIEGKCHLGVSLIIDEKNVKHVYDMLTRLNEVGVDSAKVSPCVINDSGEQNNAYHTPFYKIVKEQISRAKEDKGFRIEIFDSYDPEALASKREHTWCPFIQILPVIGADMRVYSCHDKAYNVSEGAIGDIKNQRFKDFWFGGKDKFFRINPSQSCNHHCTVDAENRMILEYLAADRSQLEFV